MGVWSFNKGEWTECYVFLRLLGKGRLYCATKDFKENKDVYIDIQEIYRYEQKNLIIFKRFVQETLVNMVSVTNQTEDKVIKIVTAKELDQQAEILFNAIIKSKGKKGTISLSQTQEFIEELSLSTPKPNYPKEIKAKYGNKSDIIIKHISSIDHSCSTSGFSIKSHLGSSPSLYNSSTKSQLVYEVIGCTTEKMYLIDAIESETGIFQAIKNDPDLSLEFIGGGCEEFENNMSLCDSRMLDVLDQLMLIQIGFTGKSDSASCKDLVKELVKENPLNIRNKDVFYETLIKRFLFNSFAGMTASKKWDGRKKLTGGYIDVDKNGKILYYRAMSDDIFETYLYENTVFDRPSRGSEKDIYYEKGNLFKENKSIEDVEKHICKKSTKGKKGDWGYIYPENGKFYIKINFQVRFK